jgi:hypothetical protein
MEFHFTDARVQNDRRFRKFAILALFLFLTVMVAGLMQWTDFYDVRRLLSH